MRKQPSSKGAEVRHAPSSKRTSASPEAKLFYYRGPSRHIPSPTHILSIDRRDDGEDDVYPAQPSPRHPTSNYNNKMRHATAASTAARRAFDDAYTAFVERKDQKSVVEDTREGKSRKGSDHFFFYDPSWVDGGDKAAATTSATMAAASSRVVREETGTSLMSSSTRHLSPPGKSTHDLPTPSQRTAFETSPTPQFSSALPEEGEAQKRGKSAQKYSRDENSDSEKATQGVGHCRHLLRRYQRYVDEELQPHLEQLERALRAKERECTDLLADNTLLTQHIQRMQATTAAEKTATSPPGILTRSVGPTYSSSVSFDSAVPAPVTLEGEIAHHQGIAETERRMREAAAEVTLLRRQLTIIQNQYDRLVQQVEQGNVKSNVAPGVASEESKKEATRAELAKWCRALSEDGLGFTEALSDVHNQHVLARSTTEVSSGKDGVRGSSVRAENPFKVAVEEWRQFARLTASTIPLNATTVIEREKTAGGRLLHTDSDDLLVACVTVLKALAATLQTEHGAVAAGMEAAQQTEKYLAASITRHQRVVEEMRREAERRVEELEADHEVEIQTLESAVAELEQQVSMTAASHRPWTAGLVIHRRLDGAPVGSPTSSNTRGSGGGGSGGLGGVGCPGGSGGGGGTGSEGFDTTRLGAVADARVSPVVNRSDAGTQTLLSLEWIQACLQKAREEPLRPVRREKDAELVELMSNEIETLRCQLMDSRAVVMRLREEQRRFLGDVTVPLSYTDNFSSFPACV